MTASTDAAALDARDVRRGGHWSRRQRVKNALIRLAIRAALGVADRMPHALLSLSCRLLGHAAWALAPALRRQAIDAVADALPDANARAVASASFGNAGENLATTLLLRRRAVRALDLIEVPAEAEALLAATLAEGNGAVFVSAHLGPFEVVAAAIAELGHRPVAVVRESYDPSLDAVVDRHRLEHGVGVIHRGAAGAAIAIVRALRRGSPVGFLPDVGGRVAGTQVRFLGRLRSMPIGPQRIASRTGAPLLVGTLAPAEQPGGRLRLDLERIAPEVEEALMTRRVVDSLERRVRALPRHWLWMAQNRR